MTVERTSFQISVEGEGQAVAEARTVGREMDAIARKAREAEVAAGKATGLRGRLDSLLLKAKQTGVLKRGGIEYGALELNAGGFGLNRSWLRGSGAGMGSALFGVTLAHGVGAGLNQIADLRDYIQQLVKQEFTTAQIAERITNKAVEGIFNGSGATSILEGILRLSGENRDVISQAIKDRFQTPEEAKAESRAEKEAAAQRRKLRESIQQQQKDVMASIEAARRDVLSSIDQANDREMAGIKNETLPVGLPRGMARAFQARRISEAASRTKQRQAVAESEYRQRKLAAGEGD